MSRGALRRDQRPAHRARPTDRETLPASGGSRRWLIPPCTAVQSSRWCAAVPLAAETLLPSYQTTPSTLRALPVHVAPLLTVACCAYHAYAGDRCARIAAGGQAGLAEELFNGVEAGGQLVGRPGGAAAVVFSWFRALPKLPLRSSAFRAVTHALNKVHMFGALGMRRTVC